MAPTTWRFIRVSSMTSYTCPKVAASKASARLHRPSKWRKPKTNEYSSAKGFTIRIACHQPNGGGITGAFPPLAGSDYLLSNPSRAIDILLKGLSGKITVNGKEYDGVMPAVQLSDEKMANVLTYILNSWNNNGGEIKPADVAAKRAQH